MAAAEDIAKIIDQERGLVFPEFDEQVAFALAMIVSERGARERLPIVCDVRLWDRPLVYFALPGTSGDNPVWAVRKSNTVRRLLKSSYRVVLEQGRADQVFAEERVMPAADYALSGGSFPIRVQGAGVIGAMTVSGLHQRDDHELVVAAMCEHLGVDAKVLALGPRVAA
jgi:uncharacterized protein (UPF0303 family)